MLSIARPLLSLVAIVCLAVVFGTTGCTQLTPAEQVEAVRGQTTVELRSFAVREVPIVQPGEEASQDEATEDAAEVSEEEAMVSDVPVRSEIDFDFLISSEADDPLDGITVELEQVDSNQNVKDSRRLWIETPGLMRAVGAQYTITVEDIEYVEGDGFSATVRPSVPEAERSEYREFQGLGDS